jgi:hypothetical protein
MSLKNLTPQQFQVLTIEEQWRAVYCMGVDMGLVVVEDAASIEHLNDDEVENLDLVLLRLFYLEVGFFVQWRYNSLSCTFLGGTALTDTAALEVFLASVYLDRLTAES